MTTATSTPIRSPRGVLRSIPFWALVAASLIAVAVGTYIALSQVDTMTTALTAGTATGVEVYAGQSLAVVGAVVLGAGVVGLLLALGVAAVGSLIPVPANTGLEGAVQHDADEHAADDTDVPSVPVASEPTFAAAAPVATEPAPAATAPTEDDTRITR